MVMVAIISTWSDRHRGPLGRRMPFMLYSTPFIALSLILLGFSPSLTRGLQHTAPRLFGGIAITSLTIGVIAMTNTLYQFFDTFPQSVYYYLWTDVIPPQLMGTFACMFRVCSTLGTFVFDFFLIKQSYEHPASVCIGAAALYLVTFTLLCFRVKEGSYPPPEPRSTQSGVTRTIESIVVYVKECFSNSYYWKIYLYNLCFMVGFVPFRTFLILYAQQDLHMDLGKYQYILGIRDLVQIGIFFGLGPIVDRFHPIRAGFVGYAMMLVSALLGFIFIHGTKSFAICIIGVFIATAVYQGATGALGPRILPKDKYGQFCSANAIIFHLGLMVATVACGAFLDLMKSRRYSLLWFAVFSAIGMFFMWLVYLDWKRLGGDESYVPPGEDARIESQDQIVRIP